MAATWHCTNLNVRFPSDPAIWRRARDDRFAQRHIGLVAAFKVAFKSLISLVPARRIELRTY
jgi:hypothetical protein